MKKTIVSILVFVFSIYIVNSQANNNLYFIQAHTFDDLAGMFQFNNYLYKLHNSALDTIAELSSEKEFLYAVKFYPSLGKILYYKDGWHHTRDRYLGIIDTKTLRTKSQNIGYPKYNIMGGFMVKSDNEPVFILDLFASKEEPKKIFASFNLDDFTQKVMEPGVFKSVMLTGVPGGVMRGEDYLLVYTSPSDGKLYIPKTPKIEDRPVFPLEIPDSLQLKEKRMVLILVNDEQSFVVSILESEPNSERIGFTKLVIKDKKGDQWFSYNIKGNYQVLRGFEDWLAGTVVDENKKLIMDERGAVKNEEAFARISPGKEERRKRATLTGTSFDSRADYLGVYYAGILYLFNPNTRSYIEWNTGQGDSEILLVQDDIVYYRINNKIFKAPIIEGKELGKPELLIQDDRVPDIHWAFISKN